MALNENVLGQQIFIAMTSTEPEKTEEICTKLAKVIIEHIQQNGEVSVAVQTSSGSGTGSGKII